MIVEPMLLGHYQKTPEELGRLCVSELLHMLDGIDWKNDREWERALFVKTMHQRTIEDLWELSYPHFRTDRVIEIIRPDEDDEQIPEAKTLGK